MKHAEYAAVPAVNWSSLKHLRDSALHYRYRLDAPAEDKPAFALGRATHCLVFEPHTFDAEFSIWTGGVRRGKEWDAFKTEHADQTILREEDADCAAEIADAVRRHPLVQPYLGGGEFERSITWTDEETGLPCKARPDWLLSRSRVLIDLKTTRSVEGRRFGMEAARFGYHAQLAHYGRGVAAALGWMPRRVLIVAVEKEPPYDVGVFELDAEALYAGQEEVRELLAKLRAHRAADTWPGRYSEEQALQLPAWVTMEDEEDPEGFGLVVGG